MADDDYLKSEAGSPDITPAQAEYLKNLDPEGIPVVDSWQHFVDTWPAFQGPVNLDRVEGMGTDIHRRGWPKPTIYREHEVIHMLCNQIDALLAERKRLQQALSNPTEGGGPTIINI